MEAFTDAVRLRALGLGARVIDVLDREIELVIVPFGVAAVLAAAVGCANIFDFDVNYTSLATIVVTGSQNLTMGAGSTALDLANLVTFNGTAATGNLRSPLPGLGDVVADGGSGNDSFTFPAGNGAGAITTNGNAGDDTLHSGCQQCSDDLHGERHCQRRCR